MFGGDGRGEQNGVTSRKQKQPTAPDSSSLQTAESTRTSVGITLYSRLTVSIIPGSRPQSVDPPPSEEGS